MTNKKLKLGIAVIISGIFLAGSFYNVDYQEFFVSIIRIKPAALFACASFVCLSCMFRAYMWNITTASFKKTSLSTLFGGVVVGYMVNGILPLRLGELFRAQYLSSMTGLRRTTVLSTVLIERTLDIFSLGMILLGSIFFGVHGLSRETSQLILTLWLALMTIAVLLILNLERLRENKQRFRFIPQRIIEIIGSLTSPLRQLRDIRKIAILVVLSILVWSCNYLSLLGLIYYSLPTVKYEAAVLLFLFANLGLLIPSTPGSLGVIQAAFWISLSHFGVPKEQALALSFAYLFVLYVFNLSVGIPYFLQAHLKLTDAGYEQ